jgi:NADH-ubiquinone oxidoreductase chain 5
MYLVLIFTPLLASILSGFFGRKLGVSGAQWITCSSVVITTLLSITVFFEVAINNIPVTFELFTWIDSESLNILWGFNFDALTASMLIPVLIVSSLVHIYSIGYMSHDPHNQRFFSYLSLFTFMMIILVTANNYLLMFVGWEGVGVCSYLLVSFWFTRIAANQSSISAFLTNRVGDCFLTIGIFAMLWSFGNIDYTTIFSLSPYISENIITLIGICLLIGAMAKSSQIGLHVWLPMAMEGPTPVSALIHAATMVTAGVYLLMRSSPLIEYSSTVLLLCLWIGGITTVFSSLIGLFQQDIKKVIAYSTMSQLGMMVIAVGLSSYNIALFHLVNHAFYKGLLFLGAGSVIHAVADNQDFRRYGGLKAFLPLTYAVMLIASLSLVAFPYMTGFYSKDLILESAYGQFCFSSVVIYIIAVIGAMFTTLYSVKVLYLTFLTNPNGPLVNYKHAHEGDLFMSLPLIILALFSIFFGYITKDLFIGLGTSLFQDNSIFIYPLHEILIETEFAVPTLFKLLPLIFTLSLTFISIVCSEFFPNLLIRFKFTRLGYNIFGFFNQRFLVELFYNTYITDVILKLGGQTTKVLDKGAIEYIGPYGLELGLTNLSKNIHKLDSSIITNYALYILSGLIIYILITYFSYNVSANELFILIVFTLFSLYINNYKKRNSLNYSFTSMNVLGFKITGLDNDPEIPLSTARILDNGLIYLPPWSPIRSPNYGSRFTNDQNNILCESIEYIDSMYVNYTNVLVNHLSKDERNTYVAGTTHCDEGMYLIVFIEQAERGYIHPNKETLEQAIGLNSLWTEAHERDNGFTPDEYVVRMQYIKGLFSSLEKEYNGANTYYMRSQLREDVDYFSENIKNYMASYRNSVANRESINDLSRESNISPSPSPVSDELKQKRDSGELKWFDNRSDGGNFPGGGSPSGGSSFGGHLGGGSSSGGNISFVSINLDFIFNDPFVLYFCLGLLLRLFIFMYFNNELKTYMYSIYINTVYSIRSINSL